MGILRWPVIPSNCLLFWSHANCFKLSNFNKSYVKYLNSLCDLSSRLIGAQGMCDKALT